MIDVPPPEPYAARLRAVAERLPEVHEEDAWRGVRWRVRTTTVAHLLVVVDGAPASYAEALGLAGDHEPVPVVGLHATGDELAFFGEAGWPYFARGTPGLRGGLGWVGVALDDDTDWDEVAEAVTESYRLVAPARLARSIG